MATYVDGFLLALPKKNIEEYKKMARAAGKVWRKYGALEYKECVIDDQTPNSIAHTFAKAAKAKPDETVIFAFIVFKSRAHRDKVNARVMQDPAMKQYETMPMPFDMKRFSYGGFEVMVDA